MIDKSIAYFHLPGLFEFYDFYSQFLPIYHSHPEYFYDWCKIESIYGAVAGALWAGGRLSNGTTSPYRVIELLEKYDISARLTFSNSLLQQEHLKDEKCNSLCKIFYKENQKNGIIVNSDLLLNYLKKQYPSFYFVSSTTKVITDTQILLSELKNNDFKYVVPDFRFNKDYEFLKDLTISQKKKVEFLVNECCWFKCQQRKECYDNVSRMALDSKCKEHICKSPNASEGYRFSRAMQNPGFISLDDIKNIYIPMGFNNFKIEGRGLGSALLLEFVLYYLTKPQYHIIIREELYLDNMLDLF